jgi:phosphonopyruvate decarboxylase
MIDPKIFYTVLQEAGVSLFAGVPDSLLKHFCAYVDDHGRQGQHIITANEGNAVALGAGHHLTTGQIAAVYMQNSGLGNAINPLTSLTDPQVYKIPMLLIIGWRGEPGVKDEPQHIKQGAITRAQLDLLRIPYYIIQADTSSKEILTEAMDKIAVTGAPVALLIRKGTFSNYKSQRKHKNPSSLKREDALSELLKLAADSLVVSTTGKTSREVYEIRVERGEAQQDFLTVGGMGHTSSIALGVALGCPGKRVVCIDGDGSALMHLGALPIIGDVAPINLVHVLLNNAAHESVGGQPTVAGNLDFRAIALACGYKRYLQANNEEGIREAWGQLQENNGPVFFELKIATGSRDDLGRPASTPAENKKAFMAAAAL